MKKGKTERHIFRRIICVLLVVSMVATLLVVPALAANSVRKNSRNFRGNRAEFYLTTGKGLFYSWGWKKTKVTVTNPNRYGTLAVYKKWGNSCYLLGYVHSNSSKTFDNFPGSNKRYTIMTQLCNRSNKYTVQAYTNAGSIR